MSKKTWTIIAILVVTLAVIVTLWVPQWQEGQREKDGIKIGAILPLSGSSAAYGNWIREALELIKDETNAAGGINGKRLEIIYEDDQGQPRVAASAMQKLATIDKVPLVYGSWISSSVLAMAPIAERTRTVVMAEAISPKISDAGEYIFRFDPNARDLVARLVPFIVRQGHLRVALFYINNDFGVDQANVFQEEINKRGGMVVFKEGYDPSATDFRTALTKIKEAKPDAIFLPGYLEMTTILKQAREIGLQIQFYSSQPFENIEILKIAGEAAEGVIYPYFFDSESTNPLMLEYQEKYKTRYGRSSEGFAMLGYAAMTIIIDIMEKVGPISERIKDELYEIKDYPTPFGSISFDEKGDVNLPIYIKAAKEGEFVVLE